MAAVMVLTMAFWKPAHSSSMSEQQEESHPLVAPGTAAQSNHQAGALQVAPSVDAARH